MEQHFVDEADGVIAELGIVRMRLLLSAEDTAGTLAAGEFSGSPGAWTVPHVHHDLDEFFYVVDGRFRFTCGAERQTAAKGSLLMVPRGTSHVFSALEAGTILVLWTPGGLEQMFLELGRLSADSLTNPSVRAEIGQRYDSVPV